MTSRSVALWGRSVPAPDGQKRYHNLANSSTRGGAWLKANKPDQELGLPPADGVEESKPRVAYVQIWSEIAVDPKALIPTGVALGPPHWVKDFLLISSLLHLSIDRDREAIVY